MATRSLPFPPPNLPFTDANGLPNRVWIEFLMRIFQRTGGTTGGDGQLTNADVFGLEADIGQPVDIAEQVASLSIALGQAFAAIGALQQASPAFGEVFAVAGIDQFFPDVMPILGADAPLSELTLATPTQLSQITDMTEARVLPPDALAEMIFPPQRVDSGAQSLQSVTVSASPFKYSAASRQALHITGGTVSALSYARGSTTLAIAIAAAGQLVELNAGDALTVTYSAAPTLTVIPR
jgi:hypothetical protein